jgi:hypothetical protein
MPYEAGLAHLRLGACLPENDPSRREHLAQARAIFEKMESFHELEAVKAML